MIYTLNILHFMIVLFSETTNTIISPFSLGTGLHFLLLGAAGKSHTLLFNYLNPNITDPHNQLQNIVEVTLRDTAVYIRSTHFDIIMVYSFKYSYNRCIFYSKSLTPLRPATGVESEFCK